MKRFKSTAALALLVALAAGCSGGAGGGGGSSAIAPPTTNVSKGGYHSNDTLGGIGNLAFGLLKILLTDAPPNIGGMTPTAINLGIDSIQVQSGGQTVTIASFSTPYVVNVMAQPGTDPSSIGIGQLVNAPYSNLSFTIDTATSNVVANGQTYPIQFEVGAASQSTVGAGSTTTTTGTPATITMTVAGGFLINGSPAASVQADFNAMESLTTTAATGPASAAAGPAALAGPAAAAPVGAGAQVQIIARPTLFAVAQGTAGDASGTVVNNAGTPVVGATVVAIDSNGNVGNTINTDQNGNFTLHTISAGMYQLVIYNNYKTAAGQMNNATGNDPGASVQGPSITVTAGQTTSVGTIAD